MSGDEFMAMVVSFMLATWAWPAWLGSALAGGASRRHGTGGWVEFSPFGALAIVVIVLCMWSADDVQGSLVYLLMYAVIGAAWIGLGTRVLPALDLDPVADVLERGNLAAGPPTLGALAGLALCYAGANIGNGPGWWVVVFSAALSTGAFLGLWGFVNGAVDTTNQVTVDRDPAAGVRLAALLVAMGLVLGRAVAGDWQSAEATVEDFARAGWPAAALAAIECVVSLLARPRAERVHPPIAIAGALPGAAYLAGAAWAVGRLPWPA